MFTDGIDVMNQQDWLLSFVGIVNNVSLRWSVTVDQFPEKKKKRGMGLEITLPLVYQDGFPNGFYAWYLDLHQWPV